MIARRWRSGVLEAADSTVADHPDHPEGEDVGGEIDA
jgi:hypothetical protein